MKLLFCLFLMTSEPSSGPLTLADLPGYRAALETEAVEPKSASFREIWTSPDSFQGRDVRVQGRVQRRFHQAAIGAFPDLSEIWMTDPGGEPICLVFPTMKAENPAVGDEIRFTGRFLKLIRYRGGDTDRLAPLVVGKHRPEFLNQKLSPREESTQMATEPGFWLALSAAALVLIVMGLKYLNRPIVRRAGLDPPPIFLDREEDGPDDL